MSLFETPRWDVDHKCEELNSGLFGTRKPLHKNESTPKEQRGKKKRASIAGASLQDVFRKAGKHKQYDYRPISVESSPADALSRENSEITVSLKPDPLAPFRETKPEGKKKRRKKKKKSEISPGGVDDNCNETPSSTQCLQKNRKCYVLAPRVKAAEENGEIPKKSKAKKLRHYVLAPRFLSSVDEDEIPKKARRKSGQSSVSETDDSFNKSVGGLDDTKALEEANLLHTKLKLKDKVKKPSRTFSFQVRKSNAVTPNETLTKVFPSKLNGRTARRNVITVTSAMNDATPISDLSSKIERELFAKCKRQNFKSVAGIDTPSPTLSGRKRKRNCENDEMNTTTVNSLHPEMNASTVNRLHPGSVKSPQGEFTRGSAVNGSRMNSFRNSIRKKFNVEKLREALGKPAPASTKEETPPSTSKRKQKQELPLRERMMARIHSGHFRYVNEQMYNSKGSESLAYFKNNPGAFEAYHEGFNHQVSQWPINPLDIVITSLSKKSKDLVIADFGCGDAKLGRSLPNKVHSFDLVALNDHVTVCDMARTPLPNGSVDVAVFCLSLMGTDLRNYVVEANRVLKLGGILKIVEVESRFKDVAVFIKNLREYGFTNTWKDFSHKLFYLMDFKKECDSSKKKKKLPQLELKPCIYKKR